MPSYYHFRVQRHLDRIWSDWFDGLAIIHDPDGNTTLQSPVMDQAALYGLISRARNMGLILLAVMPGELVTQDQGMV